MVEVLADQHDLVLALWARPVRVVDREAFAGQVKDVTPLAFVEPEDALGPKHAGGQLVVEKVLELAQAKGAITGKRQGGEPLDRRMVRVIGVTVLMAVTMGVVMVMVIVMVMPVPVVVVMPLVDWKSSALAERRAMSSQMGAPDGASAACGRARPRASPIT